MEKYLPVGEAQFLNPKDEFWMIALPWIGGALTLFFWILGRFDIGFNINDVGFLLTSLIFVDSIHIVFTFVLMASLPEVRAWAKDPATAEKRGWLKGLRPHARSILIAIALGVVIYLLKVSPATSTLRGMATIYLFLELIGPAQHTMAQMKGISLCYNSSIRKTFEFTEEEKRRAAMCERNERWFFTSLLTGEVMYWLPEIFQLDKFEIPAIGGIEEAGGAIAIMAATAIIVNALYFPRQEKSRKFAFISRVMLFPMKMLTAIGGITLRAAHGTEYLVIFRRMVTGSKISRKQKTKIFLWTIGISLIYVIPFTLTWPVALTEITGMTPSDRLLAWAIFGTFILRFVHYYTDAILYRMSDPATRAAVSPILTTPPPGFSKMERQVPAVDAKNVGLVGIGGGKKKVKKTAQV